MAKFKFKLPTPQELSPQQRLAIDTDKDIFLTGVPGTGKTVVSIYRLINAKNAILFTYGKLLRKTIEEKVNDKSKKIVNIHSWNFENTSIYLEINLSDENIEDTIEEFKSKRISYEEIIVDEGQDLSPNSYKLFKSIGKKISVSADEAQKVNNEKESSDEQDIVRTLPHLRRIELDIIYRSSYEIYDFAKQFVPNNVPANNQNLLERLKIKNSGAAKPYIYLVDEYKKTYEIIERVLDDNYGSNVGILCEDQLTVDDISGYLSKHEQYKNNFSKYHSKMSKNEQKNVLEKPLQNIIITTLKSAKGIEFDYVVIPQLQYARESNAKQYFVGVTRAKSEVFLISVQKLPEILNSFDKNSYKLISKG